MQRSREPHEENKTAVIRVQGDLLCLAVFKVWPKAIVLPEHRFESMHSPNPYFSEYGVVGYQIPELAGQCLKAVKIHPRIGRCNDRFTRCWLVLGVSQLLIDGWLITLLDVPW